MNKVVLIGNLTRDPESKTTNTGNTVTRFTLAVQRQFKNQNGEREVDFIPIVAWRKTAELCAKYLRKGSQVAVAGSIQTRSYEAQDGTRRYVTEVVADEVKFLAKSGEHRQESAQSPDNATAPPVDDIDNESLPF